MYKKPVRTDKKRVNIFAIRAKQKQHGNKITVNTHAKTERNATLFLPQFLRDQRTGLNLANGML